MSESSSNLSREYSQKHIRGGEKKVMKKTLSSVVSIALISSMFATAAFAAETTSTPETTNTSVSATKELTTQEKYDALKAAGVFEGDDTGANLEGLTDRAQIAKIIAKAFGLTENASSASVYKDEAFETPEYKWSLGFIGAVTKAGLMDGVWEGVFDPASDVTHEQIATILVKAFKLEHPATEKVEGEVSDWAKGYVAAAVKAGLIKAQADYTVAAKRSDLVESAWTAIEKKKAEEQPVVNSKVASVTTLSNNLIEVTLSEEVKAAVASDFKIVGADNAALEVKGATLVNSKTVQLTTAAQTGGALYTISANATSEKFVGLPADATKPEVKSVIALKNNKVEVEFTEEVMNIANIANYTFDNSLTAVSASYKVNTDGTVDKTRVIVITSSQTQGTIYKLTVSGVTDYTGNAVNTDKNSLQFGGLPVDAAKPEVYSAVAITNTTVDVAFNEEVDKATAETISNYTIEGLAVVKAVLQSNGTTVKLTTASQTQGTIYKVVVANVKDEAGNVVNGDKNSQQFGGLPVDTTKPEIYSVLASSNTNVDVQFNEAVDKETAEAASNYTIEGLAVSKAVLQSDNKTVKLTTAAQTQGTIYKVVVANVKDASGNVVNGDKNSGQFGGLAADAGKPELALAASTGNNKVRVYFNEVVNTPKTYNFSFDGGLGYALKVTKATSVPGYADGQVWDLTTMPQSNVVYNLTVNDVTDTSGNSINTDKNKKPVGGQVADDSTAPKLAKSSVAIDNQTVVLTFNKALDANTVNVNDFVFTVDSGTEATPASGNQTVAQAVYANKLAVSDDKTKVTLQLPTNAYMTAGVIYKVTASNLKAANGVSIGTSDNTTQFAGSSLKNEAPKVLSFAVLKDNQTLTIQFNKPIAVNGTLDNSDFAITSPNGTPAFTGLVNEAKLSADKKSITVYYKDSANAADKFQLVNGSPAIYYVTVSGAKITDELGVKALDTSVNNGVSAARVQFASVSTNVAAPKISAIVAVDQNTVDIVFDQKVNNALAPSDIAVAPNAGGTVAYNVYGVRAEGSDGNKVRVFFNGTPFTAGTVYKVNLNNQNVSNFNGTKIATDANFTFAAINTVNPAPKLATVTASSATEIVVKFSEKVRADWASAVLFQLGSSQIAAGNITKTDGTALTNNDLVDTVKVTISAQQVGSIQELSLVSGTSVKDEFNTATADATVKAQFSAK